MPRACGGRDSRRVPFCYATGRWARNWTEASRCCVNGRCLTWQSAGSCGITGRSTLLVIPDGTGNTWRPGCLAPERNFACGARGPVGAWGAWPCRIFPPMKNNSPGSPCANPAKRKSRVIWNVWAIPVKWVCGVKCWKDWARGPVVGEARRKPHPVRRFWPVRRSVRR